MTLSKPAKLILVPLSLLVLGFAGAQSPKPEYKLGIRFADSILARWPDPMMMDIEKKGWEYNNGIVLFGMSKICDRTRDKRYLDYIRRWVDNYVDTAGNIKWDQKKTHNLDYIQPATLILFLYEQTREQRYKTAAKAVRDCFDNIPRNHEGGFWHKAIYPNEMWVDGIYMAEPFLVRYGSLLGDAAYCYDTAVFQTTLMARHALDKRAGLLYHGWDADRNAEWANAETGLSHLFWSRGMGWYVMALVDMLEILPSDHHGYNQLLAILQEVAGGLKKVQDPRTGLWFQVLDMGDRQDNWIETSGSAMIVYAIAKSVRLRYLEPEYRRVAVKGWQGLQSFIESDGEGRPVITEAVRGMGVQKSYERYVGFRRLKNSTHGLMAVQLASSEMEW